MCNYDGSETGTYRKQLAEDGIVDDNRQRCLQRVLREQAEL